MEVAAEPFLQMIADVDVGPYDVDPQDARRIGNGLVDPRDRPVRIKRARAVAIAHVDRRLAGRPVALGRRSRRFRDLRRFAGHRAAPAGGESERAPGPSALLKRMASSTISMITGSCEFATIFRLIGDV